MPRQVLGKTRHQVLRWGAVGFLVVALVLLAARLLTPKMSKELAGLRFALIEELGVQAEVGPLRLFWQGSYLGIRLDQVQLFDASHKIPLLTLKKVELRLKPLASLWARRPIIAELGLSGLKATVIHHFDGALTILGVSPDQTLLAHQAPEIAWRQLVEALPVESISVNHADIQVVSEGGPTWTFTEVQATLSREDARLKMRTRGTLLYDHHPTTLTFDADLCLDQPQAVTQVYVHIHDMQAERLKAWIGRTTLPVILGGRLDVQGWADVGQGLIQKASVQLRATDLLLPGQAEETLYLSQMGGLLHFVQKDDHSWDLWGEHFSLLGKETPLVFWHSSLGDWKVAQLQLQDWMPFIENIPDLPRTAREFLLAYQPKGIIVYAGLEGDTLQADWRRAEIRGVGSLPSIEGVDVVARLHPSTQQGLAQVSAETVSTAFQSVSGAACLKFSALTGRLGWTFDHPLDWTLQGEAQAQWGTQPVNLAWQLSARPDEPDPLLGLSLLLPEASAVELAQQFPVALLEDPAAGAWLKEAVQAGYLQEGILVFQGPLNAHPFQNNQGTFEASLKVAEAQLKYDPAWPPLEQLSAALFFHNEGLWITADSAQLGGAPVSGLAAVIPDLEHPSVTVRAQMHPSFQGAERVLVSSPLAVDLQPLFETIRGQGNLGLDLQLRVPLSAAGTADQEVQLQGLLQIEEGARLQIPAWRVDLPSLQGQLHFTEKQIQGQLRGIFLEQPLQIGINADIAGAQGLNVQTACVLPWSALFAWQGLGALPGILGETDIQASLWIPKDVSTQPIRGELQASLWNTAVAYPPPLYKTPGYAKPLHLIFQGNGAAAHVWASLESPAFNLYGQIEKGAMQAFEWRFGAPAAPLALPKGRFQVMGVVDHLAWPLDWAAAAILEPFLDHQPLKIHPWLFEVAVHQLEAYGFRLDRASLKGEGDQKGITAHIQAEQLKGDLQWDFSKQLTGTVAYLRLPEKMPDIQGEEPELWPAIGLKIEQLDWGQRHFNQLIVEATPVATGVEFKTLNLHQPGNTLDSHGLWETRAGLPSHVAWAGSWQTEHVDEALRQWGIETNLREAASQVQFDLHWEGTPWQINKKTLQGQMDLSLEQGRLLGVNPGLGRIFSLFNIDNVGRRLRLDFSDLYKSGFPFDRLNGHLAFDQGLVHTNNVEIKGPVAQIYAEGSLNLDTESLEGHFQVKPKVSGTLPMAVAIVAGNPAVGAALWVFNKVLGPEQTLQEYHYRLEGTWNEPMVKELAPQN